MGARKVGGLRPGSKPSREQSTSKRHSPLKKDSIHLKVSGQTKSHESPEPEGKRRRRLVTQV